VPFRDGTAFIAVERVGNRRGVTPALQLLPEEPAILGSKGSEGTAMIACLAQRDRPLGLMPLDWLMLFTGTMLGGFIVLLF
jgi:hypothetical protein